MGTETQGARDVGGKCAIDDRGVSVLAVAVLQARDLHGQLRLARRRRPSSVPRADTTLSQWYTVFCWQLEGREGWGKGSVCVGAHLET
jgi:hypothetical protein